jgi:hypothetical protein
MVSDIKFTATPHVRAVSLSVDFILQQLTASDGLILEYNDHRQLASKTKQ